MAYRLTGTDPFVRFSAGAMSGYALRQSPQSSVALLKRIGLGTWQGIETWDENNTTNYSYPLEFNPSNQISHATSPADGGRAAGSGLNTTSSWMKVGMGWDGTTSAGAFSFFWQLEGGSVQSATATVTAVNATAIGASFRRVIGNEAALGDDGSFDITCVGDIKSKITSTQFGDLTFTDIASWDALFTGSGAWLIGFDAIGSRTDRTGNGGNELSRSAGVTLVSDPAGWSWGAAADPGPPILVMAPPLPA